MSKLLLGSLVVAVLSAGGSAVPKSPATAGPSTATRHARGSFFTTNENRADVSVRIAKMFNKLDSNHDGFVTKAEIAALQSQFDDRIAKSAPKRAARMFDKLDADHDGKITEAEAAGARSAKGATSKSTHRNRASLFALADTNKDGVITRAEFDAAMANGKIKPRHGHMRGSEIVRLFDIADTNKDGRVSLEEAQAAALKQFDAADFDHDGVLTPVERRQAVKSNRIKRTAA